MIFFKIQNDANLKSNFRLMDRCSTGGESSQRREGVRRERVSRQKIQVREKVGKSRTLTHSLFPMICGSGPSSRLAKAAGAGGAIWSDEKIRIVCSCGAKHILKPI